MLKNFCQKQFQKYQIRKRVCILYFWSTWSGVSLERNHLKNLESKYKNIYIFLVNFDENQRLVEKYSIKIVPSYVLLKNFKKIVTLNGIQDVSFFRRFL